ncbi:MAG: hypothetical protein LUD79_08160 [Oscillospiraceae bacterium]|nr:hypothetical protein [Oscillospiraceae bacterium]
MKQKENELTKLQESVSVTAVYAEITGVVQSVSEDDATAYITILETNAYQVKGTATELNVYDLYTGETVVIRSRTTDDTWTGVITEVNTDSTASDEESDYYSYYDSYYGESASKYNFYVELDSSDNLMMGQHVYIQPGTGEEQDGIWLYSSYLAYQDDGSAYVWAAGSNDKLEQRAVELGGYDEETDTYEILSGLTTEDYIAVPDDSYTVGQSVTYYDESSFSVEDETDYEGEDYDDEYYYEIEGDDESYYEFDDEDYDDEAAADDGSSSASTVTEVTVG